MSWSARRRNSSLLYRWLEKYVEANFVSDGLAQFAEIQEITRPSLLVPHAAWSAVIRYKRLASDSRSASGRKTARSLAMVGGQRGWCMQMGINAVHAGSSVWEWEWHSSCILKDHRHVLWTLSIECAKWRGQASTWPSTFKSQPLSRSHWNQVWWIQVTSRSRETDGPTDA